MIQQLIGRARARIRIQGALEGATTALIIAAVIALIAVFAMRTELVTGTTGLAMLAGAGAVIVLGALLGGLRRVDDEAIARRIDRASNLSDRLSTAIAFRRSLATAPAATDDDERSEASGGGDPTGSARGAGDLPRGIDETIDLMVAAIKDGVRAAPRANVRAATPFTVPRDLKAAIGFLVVSALAAGLAIPPVDRAPKLFGADPDFGRPGDVIHLRGQHLLTGVTTPVASARRLPKVIGTPGTAASSGSFVPQNAYVYLGPVNEGSPIDVLDWTAEAIRVRIPDDAAIGETSLTVYIGDQAIGPVPFTVVAKDDARYFRPDAVVLDPDERAYVESILAQLKELAKREQLEDLDKFIAKIEQLLKDVEEGKLSKEQLLAELAKAEEMLRQGMEPNEAEIAKRLAELGKELKKSELTEELGKALEKNDLEKAKEELEELARKLEKSGLQKQIEELEQKLKDPKLTDKQRKELEKKLAELKQELKKEIEELEKQLADKDNKLTEQQKQELREKLEQLKREKPLNEQQKQELQKQLEQLSQQMQKQSQKAEQQQAQQQQKLKDEIRRLQKQKDEAKTEQERLTAERRLQKKQDELRKLQRKNDQKQQSKQRQALKRLQRDIQKAAEQLQKPNKQESDQEQRERERQASRKIRDAARETGRVDQDRRKVAQQKKMSSQIDDLREAMRRAKQRGKKGPNDPFNKRAKNRDFGRRARGKKGSGQAWRPGQGQRNGQQQGGGKGGKTWGVGHDDDLVGDATQKSGNIKDRDVTGKEGSQGTSKRETILAAAQKGFASTSYKKVYQDYQKIVEDVMRNEKLPSSYKYYVKRYFAKIHPSGAPPE